QARRYVGDGWVGVRDVSPRNRALPVGSDTSAAALIEGGEVFLRHDFLLARRGHLANETHDTIDNPSAEVVGGDPLLHDSFLLSLWLEPRMLMTGGLAT